MTSAGACASARWDYRGLELTLRGPAASALAGSIQYRNAATAIAALEALRAGDCRPRGGARARARLAALDERTAGAALARVRLAGRFQVVPGEVEWILDIAHNEPAARILAAQLRERPLPRPAAGARTAGCTFAVIGVLADKDAAGIAAALAPVIDRWIVCPLPGPRGTSAAQLAAAAGATARDRAARRVGELRAARWRRPQRCPEIAWWCAAPSTPSGRHCSGFGYTRRQARRRRLRGPSGAVSAALGFRGFAPIVGSQVKERLTGAIILVALIVLLVPELLTGPLRSAPRAAAMAPPAGEPPLRSYTINLADERASAHRGDAPERTGAAGPARQRRAAGECPRAGAQHGSATVAADPGRGRRRAGGERRRVGDAARAARARSALSSRTRESRAGASPSAAGALQGGAWVVQLGSFASRTNAEHLAQQVRSQGFQASVSQGSSGRRLYRVRVAGAHDRAAAAQLAQKLRALGHSGTVVPK